MAGKFIVLEGLDYTGKSTQVSRLSGQLTTAGVFNTSVVYPSDGPIGRLIRESFHEGTDLDELAMLPLFVADMFDRQNLLKGLIDRHDLVLADRYTPYSGYVYQTPFWGLRRFFALMDWANFIMPDACVVLTMPLLALEARKTARMPDARYEQGNWALKHQKYETLHRVYPNVHYVDASAPVETVSERIMEVISGVLKG